MVFLKRDAKLMNLTDKLKNFMDNDPNVIFALIFGSIATGKQKRGSDIDIGIYFVNPPEGLDLLDLVNVLSELTGREVDVVALNNASALLRHQAMKNRVALTIKDMVIYRKFREKTISDYDEYKYVAGMNIYDR